MTDKQKDLAMVRKVQAGDNRAFDLLVMKYQHKVASIVSRLVYDHHEVQDVCQETFIKAYRGLKNFRGDSAFYTWLYRIAVNTAKNHLISKSRRPTASSIDSTEAEYFESAPGLRDIADPQSELITDELKHSVKTAISNLPTELQLAITLREQSGLSYEQIAEIMECPLGTVRSRIFRAREAIEQHIQPYTSTLRTAEM